MPAFLLSPHGLKPTQKETRFLPVSWLTIACCELAQPLRSISITEISSLLRVVPPPCPASVLSLLWFFHLSFSLNIRATGSHVPHKSLYQGHATFMPGATQTVSRLPLCFSWNNLRTPVLTPSFGFRHLIDGSLALISLKPTCHDPNAVTSP